MKKLRLNFKIMMQPAWPKKLAAWKGAPAHGGLGVCGAFLDQKNTFGEATMPQSSPC